MLTSEVIFHLFRLKLNTTKEALEKVNLFKEAHDPICFEGNDLYLFNDVLRFIRENLK